MLYSFLFILSSILIAKSQTGNLISAFTTTNACTQNEEIITWASYGTDCYMLSCSCFENNVACYNYTIDYSSRDAILEQCQQAAMCDSSSWIFPFGNCSCPYCSCDPNVDSTASYTFNPYGVEKMCLEYNCATDGYWALVNVSNEASVYDVSYDYFTCPAEYCTNGELVGSLTMNSTKNGCQICGCFENADGSATSPTCYTSYTDVVSDTNLEPLFADECYDVLAACWDDPTSWSAHCTYQIFYDGNNDTDTRCPTCTCTYSNTGVNTEYYGAWSYDESEYLCYECICSSDGTKYCNQIASDYSEFNCPPRSCSDDGTLNSTEYCTSGDATDYCSVSYGYTGTNLSETYTYGCQSSWICESITGTGCFTSTKDITIFSVDNCYDYSLTEVTLTPTGYISCCNDADNCNTKLTLDTSTCNTISWGDAYYTELYQCLYSNDSLSANDSILAAILFCDLQVDSLIDYDSCDYLSAVAQYSVGCYCDAASVVYNTVGISSTIQSGIMEDITYFNETINYLSSYLGCDLVWSCDLASGSVNIDFTEYYFTFDLSLVSFSFLTSNVTKDYNYLVTYIAGVLGIPTSEVSLVNYAGSTTITIKVTFSDKSSATSYHDDLSSGSLDFGSTANLKTDSISAVTSTKASSSGGGGGNTGSSEGYCVHINYLYVIIMILSMLSFLL